MPFARARRRRRKERGRSKEQPLIRSDNPYLAGGEQRSNRLSSTVFDQGILGYDIYNMFQPHQKIQFWPVTRLHIYFPIYTIYNPIVNNVELTK